VCGLPVLMGFVLPVLFMLRPLAADWSVLPWDRFVQWAEQRAPGRHHRGWRWRWRCAGLEPAPRARPLTRGVVQLAGLGYAVPGAVIVVGLLLPVGWLQQAAPGTSVGYWVTATVLGMVWAYLVRFCAWRCSRCKAATRASRQL
jgi:iron(III) transport system permease protein